MLNLLKTTRAVLGKNRLPFEAVEALEANMRVSKKYIDDTLGLTDQTLYRHRISLTRSEEEVRKEYPQTYAVIAHLLNEAKKEGALIDLASASLINNTVIVKGQEGRLSKVLAKYLKGRENVLDHCLKELKIAKPDQFLPKLGDIVKSGRVLWVSTNLLDFITASDNCANFRSCHSMDGQHFNGNLAYARDLMTLITFVTDDKATPDKHEMYKLGRSWLFLKDDVIVQPKSYGAYYDFERQVARDFISTKIAQKHGLPNDFAVIPGNAYGAKGFSYEKPKDKYSGAGAGYFDNHALDVVHHASKKFELPHLEFAAAMCLVCGCTTDYQSKGVCSEHNGRITYLCSVCGQRHNADQSVLINEQHYCGVCYRAKYTTCTHCGEHFLKEEVDNLNGARVCGGCKKKLYETCGECGTMHRKEKLNTLDGIKHRVCGACLYKYLLCSICNKYHPAAEVAYHKFVGRACGACTEKVAVKCNDCGEFHMKENIKDIDGASVCVACIAKREGKELNIKARPKYAGLPAGWEDFIEEIG